MDDIYANDAQANSASTSYGDISHRRRRCSLFSASPPEVRYSLSEMEARDKTCVPN